tara:strand:+ start:1004 stop:2440 length:1437 start_codon:yes stop_codon:yes gene_type:complete
MSLTIEQKPKYRLIPAGSDIIYTLIHQNVIQNKFKIKYTAEVYVSNRNATILNSANRVGVFKVTPNGEGYGIFDFSPILQNYVSPDYTGGIVHNNNSTNFSSYNGVEYSETTPHTIHQIDKFSTNRNSVRFVAIRFNIEAANSLTGVVSNQVSDIATDNILIYNGVLYDTDILNLDSSGNFGFNLDVAGFIANDTEAKFLTNAPTTQYIRDYDYQTFSFFSQYDFDFEVGTTGITFPSVKFVKFQFYYNGATTGSLITKTIQASTGGHAGYMGDSNTKLQFAGVGLGNLRGDGTTIPANWDYYTVQAFDAINPISQEYKFYNQTDDCKNYETIRLTWLNKFGVWDYYNFTKKSVRTFNTERKSYTQISGTWNTSRFRPDGHIGGKKYFANNTIESITLNTDYITEEEAIWLEELFNSNDVYVLEQKSTDDANEGYLRKYVKPTTITNNTHTRKTKSNDRLIQYTFNIELDKTKKSQLM